MLNMNLITVSLVFACKLLYFSFVVRRSQQLIVNMDIDIYDMAPKLVCLSSMNNLLASRLKCTLLL